VGCVASACGHALIAVNAFRTAHPMIVLGLPFGGLLIVFLYRIMGLKKDPGTNLLITAVVAHEQKVPQRMAILIFTATVITHLFGGSAGREGASLQLGGCCGSGIGRLFHLEEQDQKLITMCGMSALFSAVFGTPITATVFVIEFISVGIMHYSALVPCLTAAYIAKLIANAFALKPEAFHIAEAVPFELMSCAKIVALGAACALAGIVFCMILHKVGHLLHDHIKNDYIRIFTGGCIVVLGTLLVGSNDYNGAGMQVINAAIAGEARPEAFLMKILFTAVTIGCGFKGGEVVPTSFVGATFGCVMGGLLGIPAGFGAAIGVAALFCGMANCLMAALVLSLELFGAEGLLFYAVACGVSYVLSGYRGLYSSQTILYSKLRAEFINVHTK